MIRVFSVFRSIQGESSRAGAPCSFVRLAGCPLSCSYCDTREACEADGEPLELSDIISRVAALGPRLVEVTGGEPLAQEETPALLAALADDRFEVLLETSGSYPVAGLDSRVCVVLDIKCPGSGMTDRMCLENLDILERGRHELKFVVTDRADFDWALELVRERDLAERAELFVSPASGRVKPREVAGWILDAGAPMRLGLQLHKLIWPEGEAER